MTQEIRIDGDEFDASEIDIPVVKSASPETRLLSSPGIVSRIGREINRTLDAAIYLAVEEGYDYVHVSHEMDTMFVPSGESLGREMFDPTPEVVITDRTHARGLGAAETYDLRDYNLHKLRAIIPSRALNEAAVRSMSLEEVGWVTIVPNDDD